VQDVHPAARHDDVEQVVRDALHHGTERLHATWRERLAHQPAQPGVRGWIGEHERPTQTDQVGRDDPGHRADLVGAFALSAENRGSEYTISASAKRVTNHAGTPW
jgi:hypothetical protein